MKKQKYKTCREYRDNIRILYKEGLDYEGYELSLEFKAAMEHGKIGYTDNDLWACYIYLSIGCKRLELINMATYYAKKSLLYARNSTEFLKTKIMLGACYRLANKDNKALEVYDSCIMICDELISKLSYMDFPDELMSLLECKADILSSKGEILRDELLIYKAIKIYKSLNYDGIKNKIIKDKIKDCYEDIKSIQSERNIYRKYSKKTTASLGGR